MTQPQGDSDIRTGIAGSKSAPADLSERFSLVSGGAFHAMLARIGLLASDGLPTAKAAAVLALAAWLAPTLTAVAQTWMDDAYSGWGIFSDATIYARYLVAIWAMVATERYADGRVQLLVDHFQGAQLLGGPAQEKFAAAVRLADRRSASWRAEAGILVVAFMWTSVSTRFLLSVSQSSWEIVAIDSIGQLSWAGAVSAVFSNTLFLFLVLRWFWRLGIWAALLKHISQLELQLMPLHPDRAGGLGFLALFPSIFTGLVFALGCVVSGAMIKALDVANFSEQIIGPVVATWLIFVLMVFVGPLLVFVRALYDARERGLLDYGRLAHLHHLDFHRKWIERGGREETLLGSTEPSSVSDLNASVQAALDMRLIPIDRTNVIQLILAAGLPMIAVVLYIMPLVELLLWIVGVIF
ncbi:MAG: hypothetical protein V7709_16575 [Halioglobus sp.]